MSRGARWPGLVVAGLVVAAAGCSGEGGRDVATFCARFDELVADDPFAELLLASPGEMRDAFADLDARTDALADAAPAAVRTQADRYAGAVDDLIGALLPAGYDPTRLDTDAYGDAVDAYRTAAISVDNAAATICA